MSTSTDAVVKDRSAALFNNRHLIEVVNAISARGPRMTFTTRQIATQTGIADSLVRPVIRRLIDSGLIEPAGSTTPPRRGRAPNHLQVASRSGWSELKTLCRRLAAE